MNLLLDTHLLLWAAGMPKRLSAATRKLIESADNKPLFSAASIWEVVIKRALDRPDFQVDPHLLRRDLVDNGYAELQITPEHMLALAGLPPIHKDLVAQATAEGMTLLTADASVALYPGPIRKVWRITIARAPLRSADARQAIAAPCWNLGLQRCRDCAQSLRPAMCAQRYSFAERKEDR